jgi:hypothetical protein
VPFSLFWLKTARVACSTYVHARSLALIDALLMSPLLCDVVLQTRWICPTLQPAIFKYLNEGFRSEFPSTVPASMTGHFHSSVSSMSSVWAGQLTHRVPTGVHACAGFHLPP